MAQKTQAVDFQNAFRLSKYSAEKLFIFHVKVHVSKIMAS